MRLRTSWSRFRRSRFRAYGRPAAGDALAKISGCEAEARVGAPPLLVHASQHWHVDVDIVVDLNAGLVFGGAENSPDVLDHVPLENLIGKARNSVSSGGQSKPSPIRLAVAPRTRPAAPSAAVSRWPITAARAFLPICPCITKISTPRALRISLIESRCSFHRVSTRQFRPAATATATSAQIAAVRLASSTNRSLQRRYKWLTEEGGIPTEPITRMKPPAVPEVLVPVVSTMTCEKMPKPCEGPAFEGRRDVALLRTFRSAAT